MNETLQGSLTILLILYRTALSLQTLEIRVDLFLPKTEIRDLLC